MTGTCNIQPPWWEPECDNAKHNKYSALRKYRTSGQLTDLIDYKAKRTLFKRVCGIKKRLYQSKRRHELVEAGKNPSKFWKLIKGSTTAVTSKSEISPEGWHEYFESLLYSETVRDGSDEPIPDSREESADILNDVITNDEVSRSIMQLLVAKSPGPDSVSAEFYKNTCTEITPVFTDLFNRILNTGDFPRSGE